MDTRELERALPIPYGGLKLLKGIVEVILALAVITVFGFYVGNPLFPYLDHFAALLGAIVVFACGGSILYFATTGKRREWFQEYWKRNVRYNNGWWYRSLDGKLDTQLIYPRDITPNWTNFQPGVVIMIPLGGWFRSKKGMAYNIRPDHSVNHAFFWRIYRDEHSNARFKIIVADSRGIQQPLIIDTALQFFRWSEENMSADTFGVNLTWESQISDLLDIVRRRTQQLAETKTLLSTTQKALQNAKTQESELRAKVEDLERDRLYLLGRTIQLLRDTRRWIKSDQAIGVVITLINLLLKRLPPGDERIIEYEKLRAHLSKPKPEKKSAKAPGK